MFQPERLGQNTILLLSILLLAGILQFFILDGLNNNTTLILSDTLVSLALLAVSLFVVSMVFRFYKPDTGFPWYRFAVIAIVAALYCVALDVLLRNVLQNDSGYLLFLSRSMHTRFAFMLFALLLFDQSNWFRQMIRDATSKNKRDTETEQLAIKAELDALRQQLQPHFLFNSLNSISALLSSRPEKAREMIQQLSQFLRGTLKRDDKSMLEFQEELTHLQLYLEIEKIRFGERLQVVIESAPECYDYKLPPLILQPVVENAIKFGLYETLEEITILIQSTCSEGFLNIEVQNPFDYENSGNARGTGFGFSSIQRRLYLLFGRNDLLETEVNGNLFLTRLKIPQTL